MHSSTPSIDNSLAITAGTTAEETQEQGRPLLGAHGIRRVQTLFVNCYLVSASDERWVLVDAGLPGFASLIMRQARRHHGTPPEAIILTHGHFDHVGSALTLAREWNVPVYCHRLELPYLSGASDYPPQDPSIGGAIAFLSRAFPHAGHDFTGYVNLLPDDGSVPGLEEWSWHHTPGHTPGHISLFRQRDRALIAGDAVVSMDLDSWGTQLTHRRQLSRPPAPLTPDWQKARDSIASLAELEPLLLFTGHGAPLYGTRLGSELEEMARNLDVPANGRYSHRPAMADDRGLRSVPPAVPDPLPRRLLALTALGLGVYAYNKLRERRTSRI